MTGGAGFVGSHLVKALNRRGIDDVLVVDDLQQSEKFENLVDCAISDYLDKDDFRKLLETDKIGKVAAILHQGACTDTTESDGRYMLQNNYEYSKVLLDYALRHAIPLVYASSAAVYGGGRVFREDPVNERPLNVYGFSKLLFDRYVRRRLPDAGSTVVGLRYFNVYGPGEAHKGKMASMIYQLYRQASTTGVMRLFTGTDGFGDGEQRRDFVFVRDLAEINLFFMDGPSRRGVFNAGSGQSRSFNDVARSILELLGRGSLEYVPFPETLRGKYQSFTEADISALRKAGYDRPFTPLEQGIKEYLGARPAPLD